MIPDKNQPFERLVFYFLKTTSQADTLAWIFGDCGYLATAARIKKPRLSNATSLMTVAYSGVFDFRLDNLYPYMYNMHIHP